MLRAASRGGALVALVTQILSAHREQVAICAGRANAGCAFRDFRRDAKRAEAMRDRRRGIDDDRNTLVAAVASRRKLAIRLPQNI